LRAVLLNSQFRGDELAKYVPISPGETGFIRREALLEPLSEYSWPGAFPTVKLWAAQLAAEKVHGHVIRA